MHLKGFDYPSDPASPPQIFRGDCDYPADKTASPRLFDAQSEGWQLAYGWYKDKLKPEWRRHTLRKTEALLESRPVLSGISVIDLVAGTSL